MGLMTRPTPPILTLYLTIYANKFLSGAVIRNVVHSIELHSILYGESLYKFRENLYNFVQIATGYRVRWSIQNSLRIAHSYFYLIIVFNFGSCLLIANMEYNEFCRK